MALNWRASAPSSSGVLLVDRVSSSPRPHPRRPSLSRATGRAMERADVEAHRHREQGRAEEQGEGPATVRRSSSCDLPLEGGHGALEAADQGSTRSWICETTAGPGRARRGRDRSPETTAGTMRERKMRSSSSLARSMSSTAARTSGAVGHGAAEGQLAHAGVGLAVHGQVALVADDDGVRLVGVLVAHRGGELQGDSDALLGHLHLVHAVLRLPQPGQRDEGGQAEDGHHRPNPRRSLREVPDHVEIIKS